jgi:hypothetical protein
MKKSSTQSTSIIVLSSKFNARRFAAPGGHRGYRASIYKVPKVGSRGSVCLPARLGADGAISVGTVVSGLSGLLIGE